LQGIGVVLAYCEPLRIITLSHAKQSLEGIIPRDHKPGDIGQELSSNIKEDEEEVGRDKPEERVDLGDRGLLLQIVQSWVLGELFMTGVSSEIYCGRDGLEIAPVSSAHEQVNRRIYLFVDVCDVVLSFILEGRHVCGR
jgi:hypothetical protein